MRRPVSLSAAGFLPVWRQPVALLIPRHPTAGNATRLAWRRRAGLAVTPAGQAAARRPDAVPPASPEREVPEIRLGGGAPRAHICVIQKQTSGENAMFDRLFRKPSMPTAADALPGRADPIPTATTHFVSGRPLKGPYPDGMQMAMFGMGCFWGVERKFWQTPGIWVTAAGYAAGLTPNPTYKEVCTGMTGHNEVVLVVWDPSVTGYEDLLKVFWEGHDPTQGMRQGNDTGTQYRSGIYVFDAAQRQAAEATREAYGKALAARGFGPVTTEIIDAPAFYFAEDYHQQYLAKNPGGYCGIGGTGVTCPIGTGVGTA
jgi:peptide-methionine (S)-S-oxide reductase